MNSQKRIKKYDIIVVTRESFPIGMAGTNRIISYLKPLHEKDFSVKVYITKPHKEINILSKETRGLFDGIHFEYTNNTTVWPSKGKKLKKLQIVVSSYFNIIKKLYADKPSIIITYTNDFFSISLLLLFRMILKYRLIIEETEYPKILTKSVTKSKTIQKIHFYIYRKVNGLLVITKELEAYYRSIGVKNIFVLPMTVDFSRFENLEIVNKENFFTYVGGTGGFIRDGVLDIIKAFNKFIETNPNYKLFIVGPIDENIDITKEIYQFVKQNSLSQTVIFTGPKKSFEIPAFLIKARGIVMAPPKNFDSGGFPTKLGEFLASGTPTICTKVSDISEYLNASNSFLVNAGDVEGICNAMNDIVSDPEKSQKVGMEGKVLASIIFNAKTYLPDFIKFINE
jgi:glycosyltransferase involved in cell wall biosynthesis